MSNASLSNLLNMLKVYNHNKLSVLKVQFSRKYIKVLNILFKEGFIRGYFISFEGKNKIIHVLLKYMPNADCSFSYKAIKFSEQQKYEVNEESNDFSLFVVSTTKGLMLKKKALKLKTPGEPTIRIY